MATKKLVAPTRTPKIELSFDKLYQQEFLDGYDNTNLKVYGTPTRTFEVGEQVRIGNLKNCIISHDYGNGVYTIDFDSLDNKTKIRERRLDVWNNIEKIKSVTTPPFSDKSFKRPPYLSGNISSLIHLHKHNGFVVDEKYQRGYVWTDDDRESLIDSILQQATIGAFLIVRNTGYAHKDDDTTVSYKSIYNDDIVVAKKDNYFNCIVDGCQRLTTIISFIEDRWKYKGYLFSELSYQDQYTIEECSISYALLDEKEWDMKTILWLFIQSNRGVSQTKEHLNKVQALFNSL